MSDYKIIPWVSNPNYKIQISLGLNTYEFSYHWNAYSNGAWYLDLLGISNTEDIKGIRLSTGPNLLKPYAIVDLGALYVLDGEELQEDPTRDGMGVRWYMFYTDDPDYII